MTAAERAKFVAVCGRLGSDQVGERDAAALAAGRLLATMGLTWDDIIVSAVSAAATPPPLQRDVDTVVAARRTAARLLRQRRLLADREVEFLGSLVDGPPRRPSQKQAAWLAGIAARVDAVIGNDPHGAA